MCAMHTYIHTYMFLFGVLHLSVAIPGPEGGGGNPGDIGGLDCFCTFVAGSPGKDLWDL